MAIAMMVNAQHLMYREDILNELGISVPATYVELFDAAEKIKASGKVDYVFGGNFRTAWLEFVNMYLGYSGTFFDAEWNPTINNEKGVASLETLKRLTEYMDPEFLVSDTTYTAQQLQKKEDRNGDAMGFARAGHGRPGRIRGRWTGQAGLRAGSRSGHDSGRDAMVGRNSDRVGNIR